MKRGQTDYCAIVAMDKPEGVTSHDVVSMVRRATGEKRVGHAGTLDPFASGLLLICIGPATRLADRLMSAPKSYIARLSFGVSTDTDDFTGQAVGGSIEDIPDTLLDPAFAQETLSRTIGTFMQIPPQYSAKKIDGRKAYDIARRGQSAELKPCEVTVSRASLISVGTEKGSWGKLPFWDVEYTVSKGTYIRSLARDLGRDLGCGAHLSALRRTASCGVDVSQAVSPDVFGDSFSEGYLEDICLDPISLLGIPAFEIDDRLMARVSNGASIPCDSSAAKIAVVHGNRLHAIYSRNDSGSAFSCELMIPGGVCGVGNRETHVDTLGDN